MSACAVAFCSGIRLVVGGELAEAQGAVAIFDCSNGNPLSTHRARAPVLSLSVSADGKTMAVGEKKTVPPPQPSVADAPAPAPKDPKMFQFGSQENLQAPAAPVPHRGRGPEPTEARLRPARPKTKKDSRGRVLFNCCRGGDRAGAPDAMDTSSDQPSQPAAQQALDRAKTKIAETCERHQEMVLQLFHAERMVLEWRAASCRLVMKARRTLPPRPRPAGAGAGARRGGGPADGEAGIVPRAHRSRRRDSDATGRAVDRDASFPREDRLAEGTLFHMTSCADALP